MAQSVRPRRLRNGQSSSANAIPAPTFSHDRNFSFFAELAAAMVRVVLTATPVGVTVCGEKEQLSPEGSPEQVKLTACVNPFWGVTVKVTFADAPALIVVTPGEAESENDAGGWLIV